MTAQIPTTLEGLKSTAWRLKKERRITHSEALDHVSRMMGYPSYTQARRALLTTKEKQ